MEIDTKKEGQSDPSGYFYIIFWRGSAVDWNKKYFK